MSKAELNNQIVLMRKEADLARAHTVKKLLRDAKKLREKKGTDLQKAKNLRKADRIIGEINAVKKAKKDEITHFALTNSLSLEEILQDRTSDLLKRIKARIANHKKFSKKIAEIKEKFPNYLKLLEPGRKKRAILEKKEKKEKKKLGKGKQSENDGKNIKEAVEEDSSDDESEVENEETEKNTESEIEKDTDSESEENKDLETEENKDSEIEENEDSEIEENEDSEIEENEDSETENLVNKVVVTNKKLNSKKEKLDIKKIVKKEGGKKSAKLTKKVEEKSVTNTENKKSKKLLSDAHKEKEDVKLDAKVDSLESKKSKKKKKTKVVDATKAVSELATVKKFSDILKEEETTSHVNHELKADSSILNDDVEKEVDPFFITANGRSNYLSVAPLKRKIEPSDENGPPNKFSRQNNFDSDRSTPNWKRNDRSRFDSNKPDYKERNGKQWNNKEGRGSFNKFNNDRNERQSSWKDRRAFENEDSKKRPMAWKDKKGFGNEDSTKKPMSWKDKKGFENEDSKNLHPSWQAKKKQQDALKLGFQGKKIVFSED